MNLRYVAGLLATLLIVPPIQQISVQHDPESSLETWEMSMQWNSTLNTQDSTETNMGTEVATATFRGLVLIQPGQLSIGLEQRAGDGTYHERDEDTRTGSCSPGFTTINGSGLLIADSTPLNPGGFGGVAPLVPGTNNQYRYDLTGHTATLGEVTQIDKYPPCNSSTKTYDYIFPSKIQASEYHLTGIITLGQAGTVNGSIEVDDIRGWKSTVSWQITPTHCTPTSPQQCLTARFVPTNHSDKIADFGKIDFDGSASTDSAGTINVYKWDWGNGSIGNTSVPTTSYEYKRGGDYDVGLHVTDFDGRSSLLTQHTVQVCPRDTIHVDLPDVNISYTDVLKFIRVKYDALTLGFDYVAPPSDATCSFSATGTLPVHIGVGPSVFQVYEIFVTSLATAQLDFLSDGAPGIVDCRWPNPEDDHTLAKNCIVGGEGGSLVRWHTEGFKELWKGVQIYNSGPLTYYYRVSSDQSFASAIPQIEETLHVQLTEHLGWIKWFYAIQEPPARLSVVDAAGNITGLSDNTEVDQIPDSQYLRDGSGWSAVVLLNPGDADRYSVNLNGDPGTPFSISATRVVPISDSSGHKDTVVQGTLSGSATRYCLDPAQDLNNGVCPAAPEPPNQPRTTLWYVVGIGVVVLLCVITVLVMRRSVKARN